MSDEGTAISGEKIAETPVVDPPQNVPRWLLLVVVFLALIVRGRVMLSFNELLRTYPDTTYRDLGVSISSVRSFELWFGNTVQPTAIRPPLYPLLLSPMVYGVDDYALIGVLHVLLGVGTVLAVYRLGQLWRLPLWASLVAAGLIVVDPVLLRQSVQAQPDTLAAFLASWTLVAVTAAWQNGSRCWTLGAGILLGLLLLCQAVFAAWIVAVVLVFAWQAWRWQRLRPALLLVVALVATLLPWSLRNIYVFGHPLLITTSTGESLLRANNPSFFEYVRSGEWGSVWEAGPFRDEWTLPERQTSIPWGVNTFDELATDRRHYQLAWETIRQEPLTFAYACLVRAGRLWGVMPHQLTPDEAPSRRGLRLAVAIFYVAEFSLAAVGAWFLRRQLFAVPWLWGTLLVASFTIVHAVYWSDMRLRAPLVAVIALLAARGVLGLAKRNPRVMSDEPAF